MEFSVIDVETTGFSKRNDRIIEIAIIRINDSGQIIRTYESLINPMRDVGPSHIHGITASDVLNAPTFADLSNTVLDFLNGSVIVSHNKGFDLGFLESEFNRAGINVAKIDGICTLNLSKYLFPELPSRKLQVLCEYLDILIENAHRAYDDCLATAQLFHKMYETYLQEYTLEEFYGKFVRENIFSFPLKEKGTAIVEFKRDVSKNKVEIQEPKIRGILNRIPDNYKPAENSISEYLNLLDRILEDRLIAKEELKEIEEYTVLHGFSPAKLTKIQQEYFRRLVRYYLSDNIISELELLDLKQVATLLQIEDSDRDIIIELESADLLFNKNNNSKVKKDYEGKLICFTGQLLSKIKGELITRELAHAMVMERGLIVKSGVVKNLDYLVVADPSTQSTKAKKARDYGVRIIADTDFWSEIGVTVE